MLPTARHCLVSKPPGRPGHPHSWAPSASCQSDDLPKCWDLAEKGAAALESHQPHPPPSCPERKEVVRVAAWPFASPLVQGWAAEAGGPTRAQAWERRMAGAAEASLLGLFSPWICTVPAGRLTKKHKASFRIYSQQTCCIFVQATVRAALKKAPC